MLSINATRSNDELESRYGHVVVLTSLGTLGWAPSMVEKVDKICLLFGPRVPIVIHPVFNSRYKIIRDVLQPAGNGRSIFPRSSDRWDHARRSDVELLEALDD